MKRLQLSQAIATLAFLSAASTLAQAQDNQRLQVTPNAADVISPIGGRGVFGVGFYADTVYPLTQAFSAQTATGDQQNMRFQIPLGFGLEASYGITRTMEVALSAGYENYKSQQLVSSTGATENFDIVEYGVIPVMALFRYRWPMRWWAPEVEAGAGAAFGSIHISESNINGSSFTQNGPFYRGHIAGGAGFSWSDYASLHFLVGYGVDHIGAQTYDGPSFHVVQQGNIQGVFSRAYLKFYF